MSIIDDARITDPTQTLVEESVTFVQIPDWVLLHPQLAGQEVRLYGVLKRYARRSEKAWPGRSTLARHLGCSEDSVDRYIKKLRDVGAVDVIPRWLEPIEGPHGPVGERVVLEPGPGRPQTSNIYRLRWLEPKVATGAGLVAATPRGRTDAATPSRTHAAPRAALARPEVHAPEAHPGGSTSSRAAVEPPDLPRASEKLNDGGDREQRLAQLAEEIHAENADRLAVDAKGVAQVIRQALINGVEPLILRRAVKRLLAEGGKLAPWSLQEYVAKVRAGSSGLPAGWM